MKKSIALWFFSQKKSLVTVRPGLKKQYIETAKGKNFRKPVWKGSYKKREVILYKFKP